MEFCNFTPFPALAFEGIDQYNQAFHVVVLRQTLSFAGGCLEYEDEQTPLCEADTFFDEMNLSSVRQESDLCQFKPKCDVIVNATAYAPRGLPTRQFDVHLRLTRNGTSGPVLAPRPSFSAIDKVQGYCSVSPAEDRRLATDVMLNKSLRVYGERSFEKQGMLSLSAWRLTRPEKFTELPLRYEYAFGGQCRINAQEAAAQKVSRHHLLTLEQLAAHPDRENLPVAHTVYEQNIVGTGFSETWFLKATRVTRTVAPRIECPEKPIDAEGFLRILRGERDLTTDPDPAGFGVRPKVHPARRRLLGTVDEAFMRSEAWLPQDFDFSIWNAAPLDQQTEFLQGDETIALTNLCRAGSACSKVDAAGNTVLELTLPGHECYVLIRTKDGLVAAQPLVIDTVLVEPDAQTVTLVWRTVLAKLLDAPLEVLEARMRSRDAKLGDYGVETLNREERARRLTRTVLARILASGSPIGKDADARE